MGTPYSTAVRIQHAERDASLDLADPQWPNNQQAPDTWTSCEEGSYLWRTIEPDDGGSRSRGIAARGRPEDLFKMPLTECLLRFPSAPIHGVQRLHEHHHNLGGSETMHTYRVLMDPTHLAALSAPNSSEKIDRIILFHNGLNETARMGLYYQLASHLIASDEVSGRKTACILRPFPGHLTRFPFDKYSEKPLDHYLWDGSHLFRQFVRYMVETQWFLSVLTKRSLYTCASGAPLLAANQEPQKSRLNPRRLANIMSKDWMRLYEASGQVTSKAHAEQSEATPLGPALGSANFYDAVQSLRRLLNLHAYDDLGGDLDGSGPSSEPSIHVIGYSLGGYAAQSVFMSWPFMIGSCSTLLSGGALRELAPTAFAHPEEWQTVLHSLRYELNEAMMTGRYLHRHGKLAGMDRDLFLYLQRIFDEVFQQEYRGSFQNRLAEFRRRMFFIVGGDDSIVRAKNVLDSAPPGGINLLEVAGLGHFLGAKPKGSEEEKQRLFWLPEIARLVDRVATQAAQQQEDDRPYYWFDSNLKLIEPPRAIEARGGPQEAHEAIGDPVEPLSEEERFGVQQDGALPGKLFERCLNDLIYRQTEGDQGFLWILRNEVPSVLLEERAMQGRACALHHDDIGIARHCRSVARRQQILLDKRAHITFVLPWNARRIMERLDADRGFPSQAEAAVGELPQEITPEEAWRGSARMCARFTDDAEEAVLVFDGRKRVTRRRAKGSSSSLIPTEGVLVPSLPDCWIWASRDMLRRKRRAAMTPRQARDALIGLVATDADDEDSDLGDRLRGDEIRVITVSRARYNPRFRGKLVVDLVALREVLRHAALCLSVARSFEDFDLDRGVLRTRRAAKK